MVSERNPPHAMKATSATEFEISEFNFKLQFVLGADGKAIEVKYPGDPERAPLKRVGPAVHHDFPVYERTEAMIPMRDGVKLHVVI